jgi:NAD(P)-dependent dehydrogenase (short-subunit alcohol dehydrogenase family)
MAGDRVVIVTGGAGALGRAVVERFLADGMRVVVGDLGPAIEAAAYIESETLLPVPVSLVDEESAAEMVRRAVERFGGIDGLVCLAGGFFGDTPVKDTPPVRLREQLELNVATAYVAIHAALPVLLERAGFIVCVGSRPAVRPSKGAVAYAASKAAVLKVVETVSEEYREAGLRANAILPSIIDTPANRRAMPGADTSRWVKPAEIAAVLSFLATDDAKVISGAAIPVFGRA